MKRRFTWKPDLPDHRDHIYVAEAMTDLPQLVDIRSQFPQVFDQGNLGSCTGNGWAAFLQSLLMKAGVANAAATPLSRLFIYYNERVVEGTVKHDDGAQIRDGAKTLRQFGACPELTWPYKVTKFAQKPPAAAYKAASPLRMEHYLRCTEYDHFLHCLAGGNGVVFGFTVPASFESAAVAKSGILPMPTKNEKTVGGHCVVAVGYDLKRDVAFVRNSWGAAWGQAGYFEMPLEMIRERKWSDDFWTGKLA